MTTFDRYLTSRLLNTFVVFLVATYGLYVVFDLFTNFDDFSRPNADGSDRSQLQVGYAILRHYAFRLAEFFEMAGPILIGVAAIAVLGLLEMKHESHPVLAAGIPAFRLLKPLLIGTALLNLLLIVNQEFVLPTIAAELQTPRGSDSATVQKVDPVYDYSNHLMHIDGEQVIVEERKLVAASFFLPEKLTSVPFSLDAEEAIYQFETEAHPAGWLLRNLTGPFNADVLTSEGRERILAHPNGKDVFVVSDVGFDDLYNRGRNLQLLSSMQLLHRIRNPSTGLKPVRSQQVALHARLTRPILSLLGVSIALPLVMRRESQSLILNMTICAAVLGALYVLTQASLMVGGSTPFLRPDLAAWLPVIVIGAASTWTAGYAQT